MKSFKLGIEFPREGFVQLAMEAYFQRRGFAVTTDTDADLVCSHRETDERWLVEAKGVTTAIGLDFRTGLGQLLQRMQDESVKYGVAVPSNKLFLNQCRRLSIWVRQRLGLYLFIVAPDGAIRVVAPADEL